MKYIYVSGPLTCGDREPNVKRAIEAAEALMFKGWYPFTPHLSHYHDKVFEHPAHFWLEQDFAWLKRCDALVRLPGKSPGSDAEVGLARFWGIPVFNGVEEVPSAS
jgi:nucleoside 2-deoxyribosyltransferase